MGSVVFDGVTVVPMDTERVVEDSTVIVEGDRISWVGPRRDARIPSGARHVDGRGKFLMPGLADMHTHPLTEGDLLLLVAHGVTTIRNLWGMPRHLLWRARIARRELLGPTIYTTGPVVDGRPVRDPWSVSVATKDEAERAVRATRRSGYDALKVYDQLSPETYAWLVEEADALELPVVGHVPFLLGLDGALRARQRSIEHLYGYVDALQPEPANPRTQRPDAAAMRRALLDGALTAEEDRVPEVVAATRAAGTWNCPTLVVRERWRQDPAEVLEGPHARFLTPTQLQAWRRFASGYPEHPGVERLCELNLRAVRALSDAGARLLAGTDAGIAMIPHGASLHEELESFVAAGLTPYQALRIATVDAAEFLGRAADGGTVTAGRRADLLLLEANPVADVRNAARIAGVMLHGQWLPAAELDTHLDHLATRKAQGRSSPRPVGESWLDTPDDQAERHSYQVEWEGRPVGREQMVVERSASGSHWTATAELDAFSSALLTPEAGRYEATVEVGVDGADRAAWFGFDGPDGPHGVALARENGQVRMRRSHPLDDNVEEEVVGVPGDVLLSRPLGSLYSRLVERLGDLGVGERTTVSVLGPGLAPDFTVAESQVRIERLPDLSDHTRRFEFELERTNARFRGTLTCASHGTLTELELDTGVKLRRV